MFVTLTFLKFFQFPHVSANLKLFFPLHVTCHIHVWPQGAILGEVLIGYRCQAFNNHELFIDKSKKVERI